MTPDLEFFLLGFTSLFTMVNPIGVIPVFLKMTEHLDERESRQVAIRAAFQAFIILLFFAFSGNALFHFFNITTDSLKIVGGILFFRMGFAMLELKIFPTRDPQKIEEKESVSLGDIALTPLAIPVICGPGAITIAILLMKEAEDWGMRFSVVSCLLLISVITGIILLLARPIVEKVGPSANRILMRIMGLIVMVIAVEFFLSGLKPFLISVLHP